MLKNQLWNGFLKKIEIDQIIIHKLIIISKKTVNIVISKTRRLC